MEQVLTLEERKKQAKQATGEASYSIAADIREMLDGGLLLSISVHGMSVLSRRLRWEELGFRKDDKKNTRLRAGAKYLVPVDYAKKLNSIETRLRQCAEKFTRTLEAFRPWQWLGFDAYDAFLKRWGELLAELETLKEEGQERYDEFVDANAEYYGTLARRSWRTFQASYEDGAALVIRRETFGPDDEDSYVDWVVENVLHEMPSRKDLSAIRAEYRTAILYTQADLAAEDARYAAARATEAEAATRAQEEYTQQYLLRVEEREQAHTIRARNEAIRVAELERARRQVEQTVSPLEEMLQQLMGEIAEGAQAVLDSIDKNGYVRGKVADRARGLRTMFELMGGRHLDDGGDLQQLLDDLSTHLQRPTETQRGTTAYNTANVAATLEEIVTATNRSVGEILRHTDVQTRADALEF